MKTDRAVIADLPDKTEVNACCLSAGRRPRSTEQAVQDLRERLAAADGIERRGVVLASLMRFKQICNHPSQWLGDGAWRSRRTAASGRACREVAEVIAARQEKVLVFTQFREVTGPLAPHPRRRVRPARGSSLHGGTAVKARREPGAAVPGGRARAVLRAVAQGRRHRAQPDRRVARDPLRPLVEPGGRGPGDRPGVPHRPDAATCWSTSSCAGARSKSGSTRSSRPSEAWPETSSKAARTCCSPR